MGKSANSSAIDEWRERAMRWLAAITVLLGLSAISLRVEAAVSSHSPTRAVPYVLLWLVFAALMLIRRFSFRMRAFSFVAAIHLIGLLAVVNYGLAGGRVVLIGSIAITAVLLGLRAGLISLAVILVALALIGYGYVSGHLHARPGDESDYRLWLVAIAGLATIGSVVAAAVGLLTRELERRLQMLEALQAELESRVEERTEALAAANRELESFTHGVSHDLRAPLRHIVGYSELLDGASEADAARYVDNIRQAASRMGRLIDGLLSLSRLGRAGVRRDRVDLERLVRALVAEAEPEVAGRAVSWRVGELPAVIGDETLLRQVFANLIGNAIKYTARRPEAHIEIAAGDTEHEGAAVVFVRDDGAGFDMRYVNKLFGAFQRLHDESEFPGDGIGLSQVRRIVERHGGRCWALGEEGAGATFFVELPRAAEPSR